MNKKTLEKLEFNKITAELARHALSEGGQKLCRNLQPSRNLDTVQMRLDETAEAMEMLRFSESTYLSGLVIITPYLDKAKAGGIIMPAELRDIHQLLLAARLTKQAADNDHYPRMQFKSQELFADLKLERLIERMVNEEGEIRDDATPELKKIRTQIQTLRYRIRDYLQEFIRSGNNQRLLQDAIVTERDGRYVVPVKQEYRQEVKGIVHDESASGATVFIEPLAVVEQNNRIRSLQAEEKREIEKILRELSMQIAAYRDELAHNVKILSEIDAIYARARLAYRMNAFRPEVNDSGILELSRARHPLLGDKAVPIDVHLGRKFDILVITGPNTGGKTVALKTVGLLVLMTMAGLFIPARESSQVSIFDDVFVDIGDEQSIEQSLSTFSSHMSNIIHILKLSDSKSLVLIDELGAGTDPAEGASLARVILEEFRDKGSKVIVTTHQSELKYFAYQNERVENASVEFDPISLRPTYRLTIGTPGQSNALEIAARLGLEERLVDAARQLMPAKEIELGNMIRELKEKTYYLEQSYRETERLRLELTKEKKALQEEKERLVAQKNEILARARSEADSYLRTVKREANDAVQELKNLLKEKDQPPKWHEVEQKRQRIRELHVEEPWPESSEGKEPVAIKPGDYVFIKNINQRGYVLEGPNPQGEVTVQVGILKLNVSQEQLVPSQSPEEKNYQRVNKSFLEKARTISKEIDVRGKLAEEAIHEIDKYLEDANLVGIDSVRIIHGKGTGALRKAVRSYLQNHRYVESFQDGAREEGGYGVTVVKLR
ncbi:MAG TPA: endonuclease MutS2 [Syntrophomonadaceae bacterium]|nr:endonuclease MutS2 [Syntrophomonadaceae bacterium]HQA07251.1 endonuclease MutS2 [Syntrophomonadaceae bacterium]HQE23532.1 endonuclease MutS2 [Syntrophomonadaceae bacterium]